MIYFLFLAKSHTRQDNWRIPPPQRESSSISSSSLIFHTFPTVIERTAYKDVTLITIDSQIWCLLTVGLWIILLISYFTSARRCKGDTMPFSSFTITYYDYINFPTTLHNSDIFFLNSACLWNWFLNYYFNNIALHQNIIYYWYELNPSNILFLSISAAKAYCLRVFYARQFITLLLVLLFLIYYVCMFDIGHTTQPRAVNSWDNFPHETVWKLIVFQCLKPVYLWVIALSVLSFKLFCEKLK